MFPRICVERAAIAAFIVALGIPSLAQASPWTIPADETVLDIGFDFQFATHEFVPDGTYQRFPIDGRFLSNTLRIGARHGLSDRLEIGGTATFKAVNYHADPVILALPEPPVSLSDARGSIVDFSDNSFGAGDVYLTGRYNFLRKLAAIAGELELKLPTGYEPPRGTFDEETGSVADDVTLGDGQTDLEASMLFGLFVPPTKTFGRLDTGFRARFGGPGQQVTGAVKVGQFLGEHVILFAGANGAYTVTEGEVIGQSFISTEFDLDAADAIPGENIKPVDLRVDKDWLSVEGGVLFVVTRGVELQGSYSRILVGRNIPAINALTVATSVRIGGADDR